jgi:hypothetical protein
MGLEVSHGTPTLLAQRGGRKVGKLSREISFPIVGNRLALSRSNLFSPT